ncbi:MAG: branched-chain amino acid ABC transporter ATP-binding protein/permease [bacterium]
MGVPKKFRSPYLAVAGVALAYLLVAFVIQNKYYQLMITLMLLWTTMGLSWNMLSGYSGMISFGHASFWGLGAYTVALTLVLGDLTPWLGIPLGIVVGTIAGAAIGFPTFRLRGHYFALAMLAYPMALLYIFEWLGYQEVALPMKRDNPVLYMQFQDQRVYVVMALVVMVVAMLISLKVERSRFGLSLLAIKQDESAAEAAGINALRLKMYSIMLSGAIGSAAGGIYALVLLVITPPTVFGLLVSAQALVLTLFGGVGTLWGAVLGGAILVPLAEILHGELGHILPGIQGVVYGAAIIAVILLAPEGLYWKIRDWVVNKWKIEPAAEMTLGGAFQPATVGELIRFAPSGQAAGGGDAPFLTLKNLSCSYGGLQALQEVSFTVNRGALQGIIGPNGAGKTTLFNVLNGFQSPDQGEMLFQGKPLNGLKPNQVCRRGIGRTFQVVRTFPRLSVLQNAAVGAFASTREDRIATALAKEALERVGLTERANVPAGVLTNKERRLMELARALAGRPEMILMDETLAGLAPAEINEMLELLKGLNGEGLTIIIIEHTMKAMVRLADSFIVLDHGRMIAQGKPEDVVQDRAVIEAYLGKRWLERVEN